MISCGNDIIRISRVKESIEQVGETFLKRVYTDERLENGKPYIELHGKLKELADEKQVKTMDLSLSHDGDYAMATVVVDAAK